MSVKLLLIPVLVAVSATAETRKPTCAKPTQGRVWIERSPSGIPLHTEVCTLHVWRYRWTQVTIHASQLAPRPKPAKPLSGHRRRQ